MKEKYIAPECEIVSIGQIDLITTSFGDEMGADGSKDMSEYPW